MSAPPESIVFPSLHVQWSNTPLLSAAEKGHGEIVRFLLENGSDVEEQDNVGGPKGVLSCCDGLMLFDGSWVLVVIPQTRQNRKCGLAGWSKCCARSHVVKRKG